MELPLRREFMLNISTGSIESLLAAGRRAQAAGQFAAAEDFFRKAVASNPNHLDALVALAVLLQDLSRFDQAFPIYQKILTLDDKNPVALNNMGIILQRVGQTSLAIEAYSRFVQVQPNNAAAHCNLATAYQDCGMIEQAITSIRRSLELDPNLLPAASAYLILLQYHPGFDAAAIARESKRWNDTLVKRIAPHPFTTHANTRDPARRIRIGYVSPDLSSHSVGRFLAPILSKHDRSAFHVTCYSVSAYADELTGRLRTSCDVWRDAWGLNDEQLAGLVRQDQIDILVDLAMHTNGGRPYVFARKPAPVQVSYLAYAGSTGLATMDYRLTDPHLETAATLETADRPLTLPTYWCYELPANLPPVGPLPASGNNFITFGCLNNFAKVNDAALEIWARLLATPIGTLGPSHFLLFCPEGPHRNRVIAALTRHGWPAANLHFFTRGPFLNYFNAYNQVDVALDTFPYCGGTTTCDALSMGVPVVTLAGDKPVARAGASILSAAGLGELVAQSAEEYLQIAARVASGVPALGELRRTLREKLRASPLTDAATFTRHLEGAYRHAWQAYCASGGTH